MCHVYTMYLSHNQRAHSRSTSTCIHCREREKNKKWTSCECAHSVARYSDLKNQNLTKSRTFRNFLKKRIFFVKNAQRDIIQTVFAFILHIVGQFFREMANFPNPLLQNFWYFIGN